jgi:hypothetical protein
MAHITENVHMGSFIIRQGGQHTQTCNIINSIHTTRPGKRGGGWGKKMEKYLVFAQRGVKDVDNLL